MPATERRQSKRFVRLSIFIRADSDEGRLEEPYDRRHHLVARQSGKGDVRLDALSDLPQHVTELEHTLELRAVPMLSEARMVPILLPTASVARCDLKVSILEGADPDIGPRRRNHEGLEPGEHLRRANYLAVGVNIIEPAPMLLASNARHCVGYVAKTRGLC